MRPPANSKRTLPRAIILLGPPGSGKDAQAFALAKRYGYFILVTGDLFRAEVAHKGRAGKQMKAIMEKGGLLPAETARVLIETELERHKSTIEANGLLLDSFPRSQDEVAEVERLIDHYQLRPDLAILLEVRDEELLRRLVARGRSDDTPKVAKERIVVYRKEIAPVVDYYRARGKLLTIDGNQPISEVTKRIIDRLMEVPL